MVSDELEDYTDDPYAELGVSRTASPIEIKKSYRKLALTHHPDRQTSEKDRQKATTKFAQIAHAYEVLSDDDLKNEYDKLSEEAASGNNAKKGGMFGGRNNKDHQPPPKGFRPVFHDPYEMWLKDFKETQGFDYPGSKYDFLPDDNAGQPAVAYSGPKSNKPPVLSNDTRLVKRDDNVGALVVSGNPGKNNRPIAMEVKTRKEGPVTVTETTFKRPDGSTETVTSKTGIPGKKPDKNNRKMIEGPKANKMIEGPKQRKMLTNGGNSTCSNSSAGSYPEQQHKKTTRKNKKLLANESHTHKRGGGFLGLFGGKKQ